MLYSCTHVAAVGVKELTRRPVIALPLRGFSTESQLLTSSTPNYFPIMPKC